MKQRTTILLLAGGTSSRMAPRDKMMEPVGDEPLLRNRAKMCLRSGIGPVTVVLAPDRPERIEALAGLEVNIAYNSGAKVGLSDSLQSGLQNIAFGNALVVLADLPDLTASDLRSVVQFGHESSAQIVRGTSARGVAGHPVLLKRALFGEVADIAGDAGASQLFKKYRQQTERIPLPRDHAILDLDTPEAWEAWRKKNGEMPNS